MFFRILLSTRALPWKVKRGGGSPAPEFQELMGKHSRGRGRVEKPVEVRDHEGEESQWGAEWKWNWGLMREGCFSFDLSSRRKEVIRSVLGKLPVKPEEKPSRKVRNSFSVGREEAKSRRFWYRKRAQGGKQGAIEQIQVPLEKKPLPRKGRPGGPGHRTIVRLLFKGKVNRRFRAQPGALVRRRTLAGKHSPEGGQKMCPARYNADRRTKERIRSSLGV